MSRESRIAYLESKAKQIPKADQDKQWEHFSKYGQYMGNGVYGYMGMTAPEPREVFLLGLLRKFNIKFKEE